MSAPAEGETLPRGWRRAQLGELLREIQPGFASSERSDEGVIQLRMNNVTTDGHLDWSSILRVPAGTDKVSRFALRPGDIVFNNTNSVELVGKSALIDGLSETTVYSNHFTRLRCLDGVEPRFIANWLRLAWGNKVFERGCDRWVGQAGYQRKKLIVLELLLPSLPEQRRIADLLAAAMNSQASARAAATDALHAVDELRGRAFTNMLASEVWQTVPLIELCRAKGQYGLSVKAHREPRGVPMLRMGNIQDGGIDWTDLTYVELDEGTLDAYSLRPGDILFNRTNSAELVGKSALVAEKREAVFASYIVRFQVRGDKADPAFVCAVLNSPVGRAYVARHMGRAVGQVNVSAGKMHDFPVPCPPLPEQVRIMAALDDISRAANTGAEAATAQLAAIDALPGALLAAAFRGEL